MSSSSKTVVEPTNHTSPTMDPIDHLQNHFQSLSQDLDSIENLLLSRFSSSPQLIQQGKAPSPINLLQRIRTLQNDLIVMDRDVDDILQAKKEAIDITKNILLLSNRKLIVELTRAMSEHPSNSNNSNNNNGSESMMDTKANEESFYQVSDQVMQKYYLWKYGESFADASVSLNGDDGGDDCLDDGEMIDDENGGDS